MVKGDNTRDHFQQLYQLELCMNDAGPTFRAALTISFSFMELMKCYFEPEGSGGVGNGEGRGGEGSVGKGRWGRGGLEGGWLS